MIIEGEGPDDNEWIREEFKFNKNGANKNRIASHFILFSLPSVCSFYCYDPNCLRSMRDFALIPRFNWKIWHCSIQRKGRYVLESTLLLLKYENNWSKWYLRAEWAVCGLSPRTPRCPSVTHKVEQVSTSCPPSSNWSQQEPFVLCQHEHRGVQASLKLQTFELEILVSPSRMRTKISTLGTFLNIQLFWAWWQLAWCNQTE